MAKQLVATSKLKTSVVQYLAPVISNYNRLEGSPRSQDFDRALRMEVRDPLWTLCRQWQFGEFKGEDAGTPYQASIMGVHRTPEVITFAQEKVALSQEIPLEAQVECEPLTPGLFLSAQMGRQFVKLLQAQGLRQYAPLFTRQFPIASEVQADDEEGRYLYRALSGSLPDGYRLYQEIGPEATFGTWIQNQPEIDPAHHELLAAVRTAFVQWFTRLYQQPVGNKSAWVPEHLEYNFSLLSRHDDGRVMQLSADQYASGHLDWKDFDREVLPADAAAELTGEPRTEVQTFIPSPLKFSGMPHPRLWQMEDRTTDFGKIEASPTALLNLLLAEYGLSYSNDWFVLPYELAVNTLCEIKGIVVRDVFGQYRYIGPTAGDVEKQWQQFALFHQTEKVDTTNTDHLFYLPPSVGRLMEGDDLERVNFIRDEMSNMVWAIEQVVPSAAGGGRMLKRNVPSLAAFQPFDEEAKIRYVLGNNVPDNWIPFIPVHKPVAEGGEPQEIRLQRARMPQGTRPLSRVVTESQPVYFIEEEEVPRAGVIVKRNFQRTRWHNGKTYLWVGRRKTAGRGEGMANLMFDQLLPISR